MVTGSRGGERNNLVDLPVNRRAANLYELRVTLRKVLAAEEAPVCRERRGMRRREHRVPLLVHLLALFGRRSAPEKEDEVVVVFVARLNHGIGELLPALVLVRVRLAALHRQAGIEEQHPLLRPLGKAAVLRDCEIGNAGVLRELFVDVHQRGGRLHTLLHGETEPVCLPRACKPGVG